MKMIAGADSFACSNRSRTREAPDADDRLDELGGGHREERHVRLAGDRACEQRLAGARRAAQQHAVRDPRAELPVPLGIAEEVDDLAQLLLRLVDAGDVGERDSPAGRLVPFARARPNEPRTFCMLPARRIAKKIRPTNRSVGPKPTRRFSHHGAPVSSGCALTTTCLLLEQLRERVGVGERRNLRLERRRRLRALVALGVLNVPWIAVPFERDLA